MSSISSSSSSTINIASFNIASAGRDEVGPSPLHGRLNVLKQFIKTHVRDAGVNILCIQEVRPTLDLTPTQVIRELHSALGDHWEFADLKVNPSAYAFHRVIFWNARVYSHLNTNGIHTANTREPHFPYLFTVSQFTTLEAKTIDPLFEVINAHAPMVLHERVDHWKQVRSAMKPNTIVVGDFNKFTDKPGMEDYNALFRTAPIHDHVDTEVNTFLGFAGDVDKDGNLWNGSLDSVAIDTTHFRVDVKVIPTTTAPRASDHFLVTAQVSRV